MNDNNRKNSVGILTSIRKNSFLPLRDAVLCQDCNFVSSDEQGVCPVCSGRSLDRLADRLAAAHALTTSQPRGTTLGTFLHLLGFRRRDRRGELAFFER